MHNEDLARLYDVGINRQKPGDFVRYDEDGKVPGLNALDSRIMNYTGDWVTNNDYHAHDVVTWAADGHLYEVLKDHKSSSTLDPDNPEYYKPMTNKTFSETVYDLVTMSSRDAMVKSFANMDHRPFVKTYAMVDSVTTEFQIASATAELLKLYAINFATGAIYIYTISITYGATAVPQLVKTTISTTDGKISSATTTLSSFTVAYMD